jgi:hypothetical protein
MRENTPTSTARRRQRGSALVEFVAVVPVLLLLAGLSIEFGRVLYTYDSLVKAVRGATRRLAMTDSAISSGSSAATVSNWTQAKIQACYLAVYGTLDAAGDPLLPGLTPAMVKINTSGRLLSTAYSGSITGCGSNCAVAWVKVSISGYDYTPLLGNMIPASFLHNGKLRLDNVFLTMRSWPIPTAPLLTVPSTETTCSALI